MGLGLPPAAPATACIRWGRRIWRRWRLRRRLRWRRLRRRCQQQQQQHQRLPLCPARRRRRQQRSFYLCDPGERLALRRPARLLDRAPALAPLVLRPRARQGVRLRGGRLFRGGALAAAHRRRDFRARGAVPELGFRCAGEEGFPAELWRSGAEAGGAAAS